MAKSATTSPQTILVGDLAVTVIRSAKRKTLSLEVGHQGVRARAPMRMSQQAIVDFISQKANWIQRHLEALPPLKPSLEMANGAELSLFGETLELRLLSGRSGQVLVDHHQLQLPVKASHLPIEQSARSKLVKWYKKTAQQELEETVERYAKLMDIPANKTLSVRVRDYKRRWGSCEQNGALAFNWRIVQAPIEVFDYIVVHELAHCHEFNHSSRFWAIVAQQMPNWKERQQWLNLYGADLYRL